MLSAIDLLELSQNLYEGGIIVTANGVISDWNGDEDGLLELMQGQTFSDPLYGTVAWCPHMQQELEEVKEPVRSAMAVLDNEYK